MGVDTLLRDYDRHERREVDIPGYIRDELPNLVRMRDRDGAHNYIAYAALADADAERAVREQVAYFKALDQSFEWKLYSHDRPANLKQILADQGFEIGDDEAIMALDLADLPEVLKGKPAQDIRRIQDPDQLGDVAAVMNAVWAEDHADFLAQVARDLRENPDYVSVYVTYVDGRPVSTARINFPARSPFASLWGGSTLDGYRGRGIYTGLLALRAQEALRRGYRYLTIDASPMSRPIVAKHGFRLLAISNECVKKPR